MKSRHFRDLIVSAVAEPDGKMLNMLVAQLQDAAKTKQILRAKGYGDTGITTSAAASLVPAAHPNRKLPCAIS